MSKLPELPYNDQISRWVQRSFGGYQHTKGSYDGTIYDMTNLSADEYPLIAVRDKRRFLQRAAAFHGCLGVDDVLCYVDGTCLYKDSTVVAAVAASPKSFAVLGDRVLIFPDKVYLNLAAKGRYATVADLAAAVSAPVYGDIYAVGTEYPYALYHWTGSAWSFYEAETGTMTPAYRGGVVFQAQGTLYAEAAANNCLKVPGICWSDYFRVGDAVTVSGCVLHEENNKTPVIREIDGDCLFFYENVFTLDTVYRYTAKENISPGSYGFTREGKEYCFTLTAPLSSGDTLTWEEAGLKVKRSGVETVISVTEGTAANQLPLKETAIDYSEGAVVIEREVPDMDYFCTANNRLWGCKGDTIFGSKLGDPFNFNVFDGLSTDSYAVDTGSPGAFTACYSYLGYPTFFKENAIFKIYGSKPANFEAIPSLTAGVAKNSAKSLAVAGDMLFYLSPAGVVCYSGGTPTFLRSVFGNVNYSNGVGGSNGLKYYISMTDSHGGAHLFVYDTACGLWHREDDKKSLAFYRMGQQLVLVDETGAFISVDGNGDCTAGTEEQAVAWSVEFGDFVANSPDKKVVTKVLLRLALADAAQAEIYLEYDGGAEEKVGPTLRGAQKRSWYLPLIPKRCDSFRIKLRGEGGCNIHSLAVEYSAGSAL